MSEATTETSPMTLNEIIGGLTGFGIEDCQKPIVLTSGGSTVEIVFSNIPVEEERLALLASEEHKGYVWMQQVKIEILARSISRINGVAVRKLQPMERAVTDPIDGQQKDIQVVLCHLLRGWGQEVIAVLWKLLMVHAQNIEDRLFEGFEDAQKVTDVERRYQERAEQEVEAATREVIADQLKTLYVEPVSEELPDSE